MTTQKNLLTHGPIFKSLILFALPIFFSSIFQQLYNTIDTMIVGNTLKDESLAAIGACTAIYDLLIGFALGIGNGLAIVTARSFGSKDLKLLKKSVATSIVIGLIVSIIISLFSHFALYPLLELLNTPASIIDESYSYISLICQFTVIMFAYNLCAGLLRAVGDSLMPLFFLIISSLLNIALDYYFIVIASFGIQGAAIATVIAQGVSAALCFIYIFMKAQVLIPHKEHFRFDASLYKEMLGQGLSMGLMSSIVSLGTVILQYGINGLGTLTIAGHTAARKVFAFFTMPFAALSIALTTFVSQNKGANQRLRIIKGMKIAYLFDLVLMIAVTIFLWIFSESLIILISGSSEHEVIYNGTKYMCVVAPFYAVLGILLQTRNALQGLGMKLVPLVSSVIEFLGKIIFVLFFIPLFHYDAIIWCEPIIWILMTLQLLYAFWNNPYIKHS